MKALTVLLCFVLFFTALAGVVVLDIRLSTSKGNIRRIVKVALSAPAERHSARFLPAARLPGGKLLMQLSPGDSPEPDTAETENELVDWISEILEEQFGGRISISPAQIQAFLDKSTFKDFLGDKSAEYVSDLLNGTEEASITSEEVNALLEDNAELIQSEFGIPLTDEVRQAVMDFVEAQDVNAVIREQVIESVRNTPIGPSASDTIGMGAAPEEQTTVADVLNTLRDSTSWTVFAILMAVLLALCAGLFFTTGRNPVKTLRYAGIPLLVLGILLALPTLALQLLAGAFLSGVAAGVAGVVIGITAAVHYSVLALGIALLIAAGIVGSRMKKKAQPAPAAQ